MGGTANENEVVHGRSQLSPMIALAGLEKPCSKDGGGFSW